MYVNLCTLAADFPTEAGPCFVLVLQSLCINAAVSAIASRNVCYT